MCSSLPTNLIFGLPFFFAFLAAFLVFDAGGPARASFLDPAGLAIFFGVLFWIANVLEAFFAVDFPVEICSFFGGAILETLLSDFFTEGRVNFGSQFFIPTLGWGFAIWARGAAGGSSGTECFLKAFITSKEPRAANPYWINPSQSGLVEDRKNKFIPRNPAERMYRDARLRAMEINAASSWRVRVWADKNRRAENPASNPTNNTTIYFSSVMLTYRRTRKVNNKSWLTRTVCRMTIKNLPQKEPSILSGNLESAIGRTIPVLILFPVNP